MYTETCENSCLSCHMCSLYKAVSLRQPTDVYGHKQEDVQSITRAIMFPPALPKPLQERQTG